MKVLLVGVGGVGEAIAVISKSRPWLEKLVLSDYSLDRVREVHHKLGSPAHMPVEFVDAGDRGQVVALIKKHQADLLMNAVDPVFNEPLFDAAFEAGINSMDMAMTLSYPPPDRPHEVCGVKLGDYQFERAPEWEKKGLMALLGMGVEPGMADVFARYAEKHLFDEIEEIGVRDGANLEVRGYEFAPNFSIWTTIEECLNPPVIWQKERGWYTTQPFSEPEVFEFPEGIGAAECVNVEHEEVLLVPRWVKCKRVTFKYGLGDEFIGVLKTIKMLGLDNKEKIRVGCRVRKRYHDPQTPCQRLLSSPMVSEQTKLRLREVAAQLDPLQLLGEIRQMQNHVAQLAQGNRIHTPAVVNDDLSGFLAGLATAWHSGEVRPTHAARPRPSRHWRTRHDPFESVSSELRQLWDANPDQTGLEIFDALCRAHPGEFHSGQLRTLQRRLRQWRAELTQRLVFGSVVDRLPSAAGNIISEAAR